MQVAREFTHERTKQGIAHLNAIAVAPAIKAQLVMPQRLPRGRGITRQADQFFVQWQLKELNLDESTFAHHCALLGARPETSEHEQFDSIREDTEEDEGDATSILDAKLDASTGEETDATGHPARTPSAERCWQRNPTLRRERNRARQEFCRPKSRRLSFPLFQETTKEDQYKETKETNCILILRGCDSTDGQAFQQKDNSDIYEKGLLLEGKLSKSCTLSKFLSNSNI